MHGKSKLILFYFKYIGVNLKLYFIDVPCLKLCVVITVVFHCFVLFYNNSDQTL